MLVIGLWCIQPISKSQICAASCGSGMPRLHKLMHQLQLNNSGVANGFPVTDDGDD